MVNILNPTLSHGRLDVVKYSAVSNHAASVVVCLDWRFIDAGHARHACNVLKAVEQPGPF